MQRIRESRLIVLLATWLAVTLTSFGSSALVHPEEGVDLCAPFTTGHDSTNHRVTGRTARPGPDAGHCALCHQQRSLRSAPAPTRATYVAPVRASGPLGIDTHARIDSRVRYRLPSRSPPI